MKEVKKLKTGTNNIFMFDPYSLDILLKNNNIEMLTSKTIAIISFHVPS